MARKLDNDTTGDGGLFFAVGVGFVCLVAVLGVSALTGSWFGSGTGQGILEWGLGLVFLVSVAVYRWMKRGGR